MAYDDTFAAGWARIFLILAAILIVLAGIELAATYAILRRTTSRFVHLGIPAVVLLLGYLVMMHVDTAVMVFSSLLLIGPMAVLIPPYASCGLTSPGSQFTRILICYVAIMLFGIVLIFGVFTSGLLMKPEFYWHTPFSNAVIYAGIIILDTLVAFLIYGIMHAFRPTLQVKDEKPA